MQFLFVLRKSYSFAVPGMLRKGTEGDYRKPGLATGTKSQQICSNDLIDFCKTDVNIDGRSFPLLPLLIKKLISRLLVKSGGRDVLLPYKWFFSP